MGGACSTQRDGANINRTLAPKPEIRGIFRRFVYTRDHKIALVNALMNIRVP